MFVALQNEYIMHGCDLYMFPASRLPTSLRQDDSRRDAAASNSAHSLVNNATMLSRTVDKRNVSAESPASVIGVLQGI